MPYAQVSGVPSSGTTYNEQTVTDDGISWTITTGDKYFAVCYVGSGAVYIDEITVTYGSGGGTVTPCDHVEGAWIVDREATCTVDGSKHTECTKCGQTISTETIAATGHNYGEWIELEVPTCDEEGMEARECSKCGDIDERPIAKVNHDWSDWVTNEDGTQTRTCSKCQKTETVKIGDSQFEKDVLALAEITDQSARFDKICALAKQYNAMSAEERTQYEGSIQLLNDYIAEYNAWATARNTAHTDVVDSVLRIVFNFAGFAAVLFVFRKIGGVR